MDWWKTATTTHESAPDRFVPQTQYLARLGSLALDVRLFCDFYLVLDSDYRHSFTKWIGLAIVIAKIVASDYLMYYFVRSL